MILAIYGVLLNFHKVCGFFNQHWALTPRDANSFLIIFDFNLSTKTFSAGFDYSFSYLRYFRYYVQLYFEDVSEKNKNLYKTKIITFYFLFNGFTLKCAPVLKVLAQRFFK